ncbi:hypothetical protein HOI71_07960 [Candidatus Poribacteria bacterium]|nr:hypothetical protein [Candidatus Poribacteria bacterium]
MSDGVADQRTNEAIAGDFGADYGVVLALGALRIALRSDDVNTRLTAAAAILALNKEGESARVEVGAGVITISNPARGRADDEARHTHELAGSPERDAAESVPAGSRRDKP